MGRKKTSTSGVFPTDYITATEASRYLGISRPSVYRLLDERRLPFLRLGRSRRISRTALEQFITKNTVEAVA